MEQPPQYPAGERAPVLAPPTAAQRAAWIADIEQAPTLLRDALKSLGGEEKFDLLYKNWTVRQIVQHLVDSHMNAVIRFKLALTEDNPTIKPYSQGAFADLEDSRKGPLQNTQDLFETLHKSWTRLLHTMTSEQFDRTYFHPEPQKATPLYEALSIYAWHSKHHTAQIHWIRQHRI